ncbi:ankyrin repeat-containing domain protein [Lasiosphaeria miniovina]|uniref:Ankyrin repeat-containing domain protein n=1 Tax=Lasiosphaeria miniovina TaxID=1954250 RepID=A0AA40DTH4_9PEZI|nr:ankyrin repeat-containing domain protein [Lasiosphaeria miniovina]KAK0712762.1 ankyrin repeat-containing domain protein [Lasiosphaeria miniovina]
MIDASIRLRRAIHANDALLAKRVLKSHPELLHNPDHSPAGNANSNLHLAASLGHLAICKLLLELGHEGGGNKISSGNDDDGTSTTPALNDDHRTALMLAAAAGHTEVVHCLCERSPASILRRDVRGRDALMEAALHGHDTAVQILLTWAPGGTEAALAQADLEGNTALHFASSNGNLLVLRTLLAAGADASRKNIWNWTAEAYSATVQAEVYLKGLIAEVERRKMVRRGAEEAKKGGAVRLVEPDADAGD